VTHSFDENQRLCFPRFRPEPGRLVVTAPASPNSCPPGHYMMFLVGRAGVPSVARTVRIGAPLGGDGSAGGAETATVEARHSPPAPMDTSTYLPLSALEAAVTAARGTRVVVGITGTCPYGIGACWGGAHEALGRLTGVDLVYPVPNVNDSTAEVTLRDDGLPDLDTWRREFVRIVNGTYELRGVEVTVGGDVTLRNGRLLLEGGTRPPIRLLPLTPAEKIQWDHTNRSPRPLEDDEASAYERLVAGARKAVRRISVTGPLRQTAAGYGVHVRLVVPEGP
jgi:galactose oxidase